MAGTTYFEAGTSSMQVVSSPQNSLNESGILRLHISNTITSAPGSSMLYFLNIVLFVAHNALICFNLVGWIWPRTRKLHLIALGATLFSWFVMGYWYGWGYCLCADWHFQIRRELGIHAGESSYTELLFNQIPGITVTRHFADVVTVGSLILILLATAITWTKQLRRQSNVARTDGHPPN